MTDPQSPPDNKRTWSTPTPTHTPSSHKCRPSLQGSKSTAGEDEIAISIRDHGGILLPNTTPHHHPPNTYDVTSTMSRLRSSLIGGDISLLRETGDDANHHNSNSISGNLLYVPDISPSSGVDEYPAPIEVPSRDDQKHDRRYQQSAPFEDDSFTSDHMNNSSSMIVEALRQIPAILLIAMFHLMIGIPFGVSYFPVSWGGTGDDDSTENGELEMNNAFPLPNKQSLGIRMFLFSTVVGQLVFTKASGFHNPIGLQMVENVPFCHALSQIVVEHQGYGVDALSTLFFMFGISSIIVGIVFYILGHYKLGRVVYFFPTHVLLGCISGIGLFIMKTGVEVTINSTFGWDVLLLPMFAFEATLRILEHCTRTAEGKQHFPLLSPVYFCMITPIFYAILLIIRVDVVQARNDGYFFPSLIDPSDEGASSSWSTEAIFDENLFKMFTVMDIRKVSWTAIWSSIPTLVALVLFSLIHVPINIPAFAVSTNVDIDMNEELIAHGFSNMLVGLFGGLQNYMAYTQSVLYHKSGGYGTGSGIAVAIVTSSLFFIGPTIASFIPRCMAGTLLVHVGIDLFLEGVYDSLGKFDRLEYSGIWLITLVMCFFGMDAAMVAGGVAAVSTYAVQSIHYVNPIRGSMSAHTLRSSRWNLDNKAQQILENESTGRNRIKVIQFQGHLFFGNLSQILNTIDEMLAEDKNDRNSAEQCIILDFSLVLGIDSSAAHALIKLRDTLHNKFHVDTCIFVAGSSEGFPCEYDLSKELCDVVKRPNIANAVNTEKSSLLRRTGPNLTSQFSGSHVEDTLDAALILAEDALLARHGWASQLGRSSTMSLSTDERDVAFQFLRDICPENARGSDVDALFRAFKKETYRKDDVIWRQGSASDCFKLLVSGKLLSLLENEAGTSEIISSGNTFGEFGLIQNVVRMSSVVCLSDHAVAYSLDRNAYNSLGETAPKSMRLVDRICIRYLSARVQHVSNRIFETRCLPI